MLAEGAEADELVAKRWIDARYQGQSFELRVPAEGWADPGFDDAAWSEAHGGFGTEGTPGAVVGTEWATGDIWLRREFDSSVEGFTMGLLRIHHDEDAEVFLNGVKALSVTGYTTEYETMPITPAALVALRPGKNTIAVHCRQTGGGQYIDVGLVEVIPVKE